MTIPFSYVWHDSFTRVTWQYLFHAYTCQYLLHMCDMILSHVWHGTPGHHWWGILWVCRFIHRCDTTPSYGVDTMSRLFKMIGLFCKRALQKRRYSAKEPYNCKEPTNRSHRICAIWLIHTCAMTHSYVWHDSLICVTWLIPTCNMPRSYVWYDSFICVTRLPSMGWVRIVGSFKLQVSFAEYSLFYRALLQKRPMILRSQLIVATPYVWHDSFLHVTWLIHMCDMTHSYVWHDSFIL